MSQKRTSKEIIGNIRILLDELDSTLKGGGGIHKKGASVNVSTEESQKKYSGISGGIKMLIADGFFEEPKLLSEVVNRLRREGFNYRRPVIAMALLRAVRSRSLARLEADSPENQEKWAYAERR